MDDHQTANAFLQLAHIGLLFLVIARRNGRLISFAPLCSASGSGRNADVQSPLPWWLFLFQLGVFVGGFHQRQFGLLMADGVETVAQALDFIFSTSFMMT